MTTAQAAPQIEQDAIKDPKNYFCELASIDVSNYIEKKDRFSYLSWPFAIDQLKRMHPDAQIIIKRFPDPDLGGVLVPYMKTSLGVFVEVEVTINGISYSEPYPVTDYRNKPIAKPNTMDINNSLKRAMVKSIAFHGLGLYIYAGEDLPIYSDDAGQAPQETQVQMPRNMNQNVQENIITEMQKQKIRELSNELASLNLGVNANNPEMKKEAMLLITEAYNVKRNMTVEQANHAIEGIQGEIKHIHNQRMAAAQSQQNASSFEAAMDEL